MGVRPMARSRGWFGSVSVLGLVLAMVLAAAVIPTVAATPASANLNGVFPANGDEDLTEQFTSRDALFAYTVSDLSGGRMCIIPATEDGSCGDPAWGSPNF